jgi:2-haloacid dehalogenase
MMLDRRSFLVAAASAAMQPRAGSSSERISNWTHIKALAFDAFPVFDPRSVFRACEDAFPGRGVELGNLWRTRQFEYQWLRALGGRYEDFWQTTHSALDFAARSLKLELSGGKVESLMAGYLAMKAWPDVPDALRDLRRSGRKLVLLSNATATILDAGIHSAGLEGVFDDLISTDRIRTFKPDPRAYQLGIDVLALRKEEIMFVAFAGWDAAGAKWFGYPTFWNNRQGAPLEELSASPDGTGESLAELVRLLGVRPANIA